MSVSKVSFDTVRKIGLELPGVESSTAYGMPALKTKGKLLAAVPANVSAEPGSLVVRVSPDDRAELLAADPLVYYLTDHYLDFDGLLVRLNRISPEVLRDLLSMSYKYVNRKPKQRKR